MGRRALRTLASNAWRVMNLGMLRREHRRAEATSDLVDGAGSLAHLLTRAEPITKCFQYTALTLIGEETLCDLSLADS